MKKFIIIIILGISVSDNSYAKTPYNKALDQKEIAWMDLGVEQIRQKLKDPDSAEFSDVFFSKSGGVPAACGYVNAKNALGGYIGKQRFFTSGERVPVILESQMSDFSLIWNKFCQ
jgi:hypothetical protein